MPKRAVLHNDDESHQIGAEDRQQNQLVKLVRRRERNKQWRLRKNKSDLNNYLFDKIETCQLFGMKQQFMEWLGVYCFYVGFLIFSSLVPPESWGRKNENTDWHLASGVTSYYSSVWLRTSRY